jgi:hypothetical protein
VSDDLGLQLLHSAHANKEPRPRKNYEVAVKRSASSRNCGNILRSDPANGNTSSNVLEILGLRVEGPANKVVDQEGLGENTGDNIDSVNCLAAAVQGHVKTKN